MTILNTIHNPEYSNLFLGSKSLGIARYDKIKYRVFDRLTKDMKGFFWQPEEIDLQRDKADFKQLSPHEEHIFTSNIKRQIVLDSVQGRAPSLAFLPVCTLPEFESFIVWWTATEQVHSYSYTHIIQNVYPDPTAVLDAVLDIKEVVSCAEDISKYYDDLIAYNNKVAYAGYNASTTIYNHKRAIWLALNSVNALEGVRFYVSFACSWAFAKNKKMEGNAKIIKLICRDENIHLGATQTLLKLIVKEDPDFANIQYECKDEVIQIFKDVVNQEKEWAEYLFKDGSIIGLSKTLLCQYVEYIANSRLASIGYDPIYKKISNPLPWTLDFITSKGVQVAPQEAEKSEYRTGEVKQDINVDTFKSFEL